MSESTLKIENITGQASRDIACGVFNKKITLANGEQGTLVACVLIKNGQDVDIQILLKDIFEPPKSLEITFEEGSGPIKIGQIYLISTEKFLSIFDGSVFLNEAQELDIEEIIDGLATEISARKDQEEIGAAFVLIKDEAITEGTEDTEGKGETEKAESLEAKELVEDSTQGELMDEPYKQQEMPPKRKLPQFKNPLPFAIQFLGKLVREVRSLKRGDI